MTAGLCPVWSRAHRAFSIFLRFEPGDERQQLKGFGYATALRSSHSYQVTSCRLSRPSRGFLVVVAFPLLPLAGSDSGPAFGCPLRRFVGSTKMGA
jgi:hypothetical protein